MTVLERFVGCVVNMNKRKNNDELITLERKFTKLLNQIKVLLCTIMFLLIFILTMIALCFGSAFEMFVCCVFVALSMFTFDFCISKV